LQQQVQVFKVVMVPREQHPTILDSVPEVARIRHTGETCIRKDGHLMAGFLEEFYQRCLGAVIVQIEIHTGGLELRGA
jgi:hypothetical protein